MRELRRLLIKHNLSCWLDEEELRPGHPWQPLLEEGIRTSKSVAVLVGAKGIGPWQDEEMQAALSLVVQNNLPVIPVLLPGCPEKPELWRFHNNRTYVGACGGKRLGKR